MSVAENTGAQLLAVGSWQVDPVRSVVEFRIRQFGVHPDGRERIAFALQGELDRTDLGLVAVRPE
jgi:polyisoprenoid-binding protein YceI